MHQYFYCKSWFSAKKKAIESWNKEEARSHYDTAQCATVLVDSPEKPSAVITIADGVYDVVFLDKLLRGYMAYEFVQIDDDRLFLSLVTHREYDGKSDNIRSGNMFKFERSGRVYVEKQVHSPSFQMESYHSEADISRNYEAIPQFDAFEELLVLER